MTMTHSNIHHNKNVRVSFGMKNSIDKHNSKHEDENLKSIMKESM